jgi:hypothetical protein
VVGFNAGRKTMRVTTATGERVTVPITMLWVITKNTANGEDVRTALARKIGVDVSQELVVPTRVVPDEVTDEKEGNGRKPTDNNAPGFSVFLETYNHQLSLVVNTEDIDAAKAVKDLERLGFQRMPDYGYSKVANWKVLQAWLDKVQKRVGIHPEYLSRLEEDVEAWRQGKTLEKFAYGLAASGRKTFLLAQKQRLPAGVIKPYLTVHNHKVFLCLNTVVNAASFQKVRASQVPGISWKSVTGEHWCLVPTKQAAQALAKQLFNSYNIVNREDLVKDFADVRVIKITK